MGGASAAFSVDVIECDPFKADHIGLIASLSSELCDFFEESRSRRSIEHKYPWLKLPRWT